MIEKFLAAKNWGVFMGAWILETALWVTVVGVVHRGPSLFLSLEAMTWAAVFFFSSMAIQAALLRPVSFALASITAHRIGEFSARHSLIIGYLFSLALTVLVSRFTSYEKIFFVAKNGAPSVVWFAGGAGLVVAAIWLCFPAGLRTLRKENDQENQGRGATSASSLINLIVFSCASCVSWATHLGRRLPRCLS